MPNKRRGNEPLSFEQASTHNPKRYRRTNVLGPNPGRGKIKDYLVTYRAVHTDNDKVTYGDEVTTTVSARSKEEAKRALERRYDYKITVTRVR